MRIIAADDEALMLDMLTDRIRQACPQGEIHPFSSARRLLAWLEETGEGFDVAFLDIEMPGMSGIALAQRLKELCPRGNLIFVTGFSQYMAEAFQLHASGYIRKPVTVKAVEEELRNLRYPVQERAAPTLRVQAFGNFEVFYGGRPVHFSRSRTKELFAYLIDRRGAGSTMGELISILWEGRLDTPSIRSQLRSLITDLRTTLQGLGQGAIIIKKRDLIAVDPERVDCDYYRFLAGDRREANAFRGEYMSNYSWAETTLGALTRKEGQGETGARCIGSTEDGCPRTAEKGGSLWAEAESWPAAFGGWGCISVCPGMTGGRRASACRTNERFCWITWSMNSKATGSWPGSMWMMA